ncbi:uncharacterized protein LOC109853045 [Pseudomyrmex gracilis]|uniref:uncharacterized protein LOC109853045 n=1 Tax=Pseudomyrmex gracilis TaxID=219809 RepID=UPI00099564DF|nr:uncharacterized protein LOC109853045 [Pseudomyrmex gracilis]
MIPIDTERFKLNRILLLAIGLWPYEQSLLARIQFASFFAILIAFIVFQITALWTPECTLDCAIKIVSCALFCTVSVIKYNSFKVNSSTVKYLLEHLKYICDGLRDKNEIDIMKHYGNNATQYTARIMLVTLVCLCVVMLLPILPLLLDIVLPMNESRSRFAMPIVTCYFINQEKYAYLILLHTMVASCIGAIAIIGPGTLMITYLKHTCGMFNIVSYRIQQAMSSKKSKKFSLENKNAICKSIAYGVDIHRTAMELIFQYGHSTYRTKPIFYTYGYKSSCFLKICDIFYI